MDFQTTNLRSKNSRKAGLRVANSQTTDLQTTDLQTTDLQTINSQTIDLRISQSQSPALLFELEDELALRGGRSQSVLDVLVRVQRWTGAEPFLIELLSRQLLHCLPLATNGEEARLVDELVQRKIVEDWRRNTAAAHLSQIESMLLSYPQRDSLLILYLKVLQRGGAEANNSTEQATLIASGLVVLNGDLLKVANAIYENVFDLDWIEQQIPGLTRPVSIVRSGVLPIGGSRRLKASASPASADRPSGTAQPQPTPTAKLYSKAMVLFCCMAVVAAVMATYLRKPESPAMATASVDEQVDLTTDQQRFDSGTEHARNSRWLMMMRDFCLIPEESAYFEPARRSMEKWVELYGEDIEVAKVVWRTEQKQSCAAMP